MPYDFEIFITRIHSSTVAGTAPVIGNTSPSCFPRRNVGSPFIRNLVSVVENFLRPKVVLDFSSVPFIPISRRYTTGVYSLHKPASSPRKYSNSALSVPEIKVTSNDAGGADTPVSPFMSVRNALTSKVNFLSVCVLLTVFKTTFTDFLSISG